MLNWLNINTVLFLAALAWHYSLFCGFVSDDHSVIEKRKDIIPESEKNPMAEKHWIKVFNDGPVLFYLNKLMWRIAGHGAFGWHLLNFSLHILNVYLFYQVAALMLPEQTALLAALLWAVNPMHNQVAVWCSGRPYSIAATFALIAMLNYHNPFLVIPLYVIGVMTNVSIIPLPFLIKLMNPEAWQGTVYLWCLALIVPWFIWKFAQRFGKGALILDRQNYQFNIRRFNNLARVYVYYIFSLVFPVRMGWYHEAGFRFNNRWNGFNVWALIGYAMVFVLVRQGASGWWFLLGLLPNMNVFATNSYLQDRYLYFGSMGLALLAANALHAWPELLIAIIAVHIAKSYTYSRHMVNDERLYRENVRNHPKSDYALNNLGFFLIQQQRLEEARAIIKRGLDIDDTNKLLWYNLGITWAAQGHLSTQEGTFRFMRALDCWKMALSIEPRWNKPREDIDKLVTFLVANKVLTVNKNEAAPDHASISMPKAETEEPKK